MHRLLIAAVVVRLVAALILAVGPFTNDAAELEGWDVDRFQQIADADGRPWVDHPVEYPPGSVVAIELVARDDVVATHRWLVVLSLVVDLGLAALVAALGGWRAAGWYLLLGLPLVPMGYERFDLWAGALAVVGLGALLQRKPQAFAAAVAAGAMVKVWPALVVAAAVALGRWRSAMGAVAAMAAATVVWVGYAGWSPDAVEQVISLRGATGWHVESVGGTVVALTTDAQAELQLDAYRIGDLDDRLVLASRGVAVLAIAALALFGRRALSASAAAAAPEEADGEARTMAPAAPRGELEVVSLVVLGAVAALIVSSPLLSPQFLLWLTPFAALAVGPGDRPSLPVLFTALAAIATGAVLAVYGPPRLDETNPAAILAARNAVLAAVVVASLHSLAGKGPPLRPTGRLDGERRRRPRPNSSAAADR